MTVLVVLVVRVVLTMSGHRVLDVRGGVDDPVLEAEGALLDGSDGT